MTAGAVVAGQLVAARWQPSSAMLATLLGVVALASLAAYLRPRLLVAAMCAAGVVLGAVRMRTVTAPAPAACDVARLPLPLRTMLVGRVVAAPERRGDRTVVLLEAEAIGRTRACGLVRLAIRGRGVRRRWQYGDRLR